MIFSGIKGITIPEGVVQQIANGAGSILWKGGLDVASMAISYTGAYTDQLDVVMSGKTYRLLTLTGSGTLTLEGDVTADVWMCNGGNGGDAGGFSTTASRGGGGGYLLQQTMQLVGSIVCQVGAGGAAGASKGASGGPGSLTAFGNMSPDAQSAGADGASGGGHGGYYRRNKYYGKGTGIETTPFVETSLFAKHSAGGGGGGWNDVSGSKQYSGGNGGSNGGNGDYTGTLTTSGGSGGQKGGGAGGAGNKTAGKSASFYGSGGGAGGSGYNSSGNSQWGLGGSGYQGVIYVRIPYEQ